MNVVFCYHSTDYEYHLGIATLAAALEPLHTTTSLVIYRELVTETSRDTVEDTVDRILVKNPDIVAFSVMTFNWRKIQKVIKLLRPSFSGLIVVGGCHAMLCPEEVLAFPGVDAVCPGEGEKPLRDLVQMAQRYSLQELPDIEGLYFSQDAGKNMSRPWCNEHPEDFPYLSYEIFDQERNKPMGKRVTGPFSFAGLNILPAITSRGCPYKCTYCNNHSFMNLFGPQRFIRTFSVPWVVSQIKALVHTYHPEFIDFMDEMFLKGKPWMLEFCSQYNRDIGLPYSINVRIDRCTEDIVRLLADSGLKLVLFGLECGDETYRSQFLNRHMSNADILRGADILRKYGILIISFNMFGLPLETPEIMAKTFELNRQLQPDAIAPFIYQPMPQTPLGRLAFEHGLVQDPPEDHWDYLVPALDSEVLPAGYVQEQVELFRQEFNSPEHILAVTNKMRTFTGKEPWQSL